MLRFEIKAGVDLGVEPALLLAIEELKWWWWDRWGYLDTLDNALVLTSARRRSSARYSLHPAGLAADFRSRHLVMPDGSLVSDAEKAKWASNVSRELAESDFLYEDTVWRAGDHRWHQEHAPTPEQMEAAGTAGLQSVMVRKQHFHLERDVGRAAREGGRL